MTDATVELLRELTEAHGIPGYEQEVRQVIRRHLKDLTTIEQDRLGSIVCRKDGKAESPRVMLAGHMDEIGFIVKLITEEGKASSGSAPLEGGGVTSCWLRG